MATGKTLEELQKMGAKPVARTGGLTLEQVQAKIPPPIKEPPMQKAARLLDTFFGAGKVGEAIGTEKVKSDVRAGKTGAIEFDYSKLSPEAKARLEAKGVPTNVEAQREEVADSIEGPTKGQIAGSALKSAALFTPVGKASAGITALARGAGMKVGASALGKIGAGAIAGEVFDVAQNLEEGETGAAALKPGMGTAIGGGIPALGVAKNVAVRFAGRQGPRIINSLIKPLAKDFSYGKNPGRAVAEEGIIANNFDDLADKIRSRRQEIGQKIGEVGRTLSDKAEIKVTHALDPINDAMKVAAAQNNPTLLNRLTNVKTALTSLLEPGTDDAGNVVIKKVGDRKLENLTFSEVRDLLGDIGDMTQFTGNHSDDKLVNSALKQVYGQIKEASLKHADTVNPAVGKEFRKLTEKYADLSSAEIATKYRDKIVERSAMIGLNPTVAGLGTAVVTAIATGGASVPVILAGASAAALDKLAQTPGFKTRLAALLSRKTSAEAATLFQKIPALQKLFPKGGPVSPGDRLLQTKAGQKFEKGVVDYVKNPKLGASIQAITPESIAKKIDGRDLDLIRGYLKGGLPAYQRAQSMIKAMGLESMDDKTLQRFFTEVMGLSTKKLPVKSSVNSFTKGAKGLFTGSTKK